MDIAFRPAKSQATASAPPRCGRFFGRDGLNRPVSNHLNPDLSVGQIFTRVLFSLAVTALVGIGAYFTIAWLAALHP
jgi:hypothetical protein